MLSQEEEHEENDNFKVTVTETTGMRAKLSTAELSAISEGKQMKCTQRAQHKPMRTEY